jgi:hypothetical protein
MADKRTTPETPERAPRAASAGPGGKKRAAPTIDLTATEMPSAPQAAAPGSAEPPPPAEPPPAVPEPPAGKASDPPAGPAAIPPRGNSVMATLAACVAGAAAVMLVAAALWFSGLLPLRYAAPTDTATQAPADNKAIDALTQRVGKIEETMTKLPAGDTAVAQRLTAADSAMKSLGVALAALNHRTDDAAANAAQARERADAAAKAVAELQASFKAVAPTEVSRTDIAALDKRIAALESAAQTARADISKIATTSSGNDNAARLVLSAAVLRDAVLAGAPFADELATVKQLGGDDKTLAPLASFAATGVPAAPTLAQELGALLPAMLKISEAQAAAGGFLDRLEANAGRLVRIRPVNAPPGDDASAVLARLESDAAKADIPAALTALGKLPEATRAPALAWIAKARARHAALSSARQYAADTARALGPKVGTQ